MKSFTLDYLDKVDFIVLAINSHAKGYKICWEINNRLKLNFIKNNFHKPQNTTTVEFARFTSLHPETDTQYDLLNNYSKNGFLLPKYRNIDYFLKIQNPFWEKEKADFIKKLGEIAEILLIFEFDLDNINSLDPFIFNDKEN